MNSLDTSAVPSPAPAIAVRVSLNWLQVELFFSMKSGNYRSVFRGNCCAQLKKKWSIASVVAPQFAGLSRLEQHKLVYAAVQSRFDDGSIHALALKTRAPEAT